MKKDWLMVHLGDVCKINPKKSEIKNKNIEVSFVPMAQLNEHTVYFESKETRVIKEVFNNYTYFKDKDVLLAKITPCFENGKSGIAKNLKNTIGFGSTEFIVLRSSDKILPKFIYYLISNDFFRKEGINKMKGTAGHKRVPVKFVERYKIPLAPLPEQKAIVQKIETLLKFVDEGKKELEVAKEKLKIYRQSVLKKAFEGKLLNRKELEVFRKSKDWKQENQLLKDVTSTNTKSDSSKTKENWLTVQLGNRDYIEIIDGDRGKNYPKKSEFMNKGYCLFLNTRNVRKGYFNFDKCDFISKNLDNLLRKGKANRLDIILTTRGTLGNSALFENSVSYSHLRINSGMVLLRCNRVKIIPKFLLQIINSNVFSEQIKKHRSGSAQPQLPVRALSKIKIPLAPFSEQKAIVQKIEHIFSHCDKTEIWIEQNLQNVTLLKQSILKKAFLGELLNKKELEKCRKASDWKPVKELLAQIQKGETISKKRKFKNKRKAV